MQKVICRRLRRGQDLLGEIRAIAAEQGLQGAVIASAVGCLSRACLRDASGLRVRQVEEPCEILNLTGTVSAARVHLHLSLAKEDLSAIGGHLMPGCLVNTTCELVLLETGWRFGVEEDPKTGYDEVIFLPGEEIE